MKRKNNACTLAVRTLAIFVLVAFAPRPAPAAPIPVVEMRTPASPLITFRIQFRTGSADDPAGKAGLARLTASMMTDGATTTHSYREVSDILYPMAASVRARVDREVTTFVGTVHRDHLEKYYSLLVEMMTGPAMDPADFDRVRSNQLNYITKTLRTNDDEEFGKQALQSMLYAGQPYGHPVAGLESDLKAITLDDVRNFYSAQFTRNNVTIALAGGYPPSLPARVRANLAHLSNAHPEPMTIPEPKPVRRMPVLVVEKPGRATAISMGFPIDITRADPDFYPLLVANSYFGEHRTFNGRLMIRMRQVRGLNYGDYSYIENFIQNGGSTFPVSNIPRHQQFFSIWIRPVAPQNSQFAIRLALFELEKLVRDGISPHDFENTRQFLINYSRLWAQNQSQRLGYKLDARFYGTDNILDVLPARLKALSVNDVNRAIKRHLNYRNICIAIITSNADKLMQDLIANTPSPITYDNNVMPASVLDEDQQVAVYRLQINRSRARVVPAADMFR